MVNTNYALAQRAAHSQRPPDQVYKSRSVTGQVPAKLEDRAARDFMRYRAKATDPSDRAYLDAQIQRLGIPWVVQQ